jgi:hypothetical protein
MMRASCTSLGTQELYILGSGSGRARRRGLETRVRWDSWDISVVEVVGVGIADAVEAWGIWEDVAGPWQDVV